MSTPDPPDQGGTWISSGEIYAELRRIGDAVVELRLQLAEVTQLRTSVEALRGEADALRTDLEALKARRWPLQTIMVASGLASAVIALVALLMA